jgi:NTE family protein
VAIQELRPANPRLGLTLSGGGVRAAVFHLGVLLRLANEGMLERVSVLSTVSGGSIALALVFTRSDMQWPSSAEYASTVYPALRDLVTSTDLLSFRAIGWSGLLRHNVRLLRDRADLLAHLLEDRWKVRGELRDLPDKPVWWINATNIETGKNWRFAKREMGDWRSGRHYTPRVRLSQAVASSAAVPYGIGALRLKLPADGWNETDPASSRPIGKAEAPGQVVRLWDGGAYENLGLEALYKPGKALRGCDFLVCSDASAPLGPPGPGPLRSLLKGELWSPRLFDVSSDQIRALRSRMLFRDFDRADVLGVVLRMGHSVREIDRAFRRERDRQDYDTFLSDEEGRAAAKHPTALRALPIPLFERIARHGFEVTDATLTGRAPDLFKTSFPWRGPE